MPDTDAAIIVALVIVLNLSFFVSIVPCIRPMDDIGITRKLYLQTSSRIGVS